jgi:heme/copper-type cytochrome/quinol oxidase subunit 2
MRNSTIVYFLWVTNIILSLFVKPNFSLLFVVAAVYFANKVKEQESRELGTKLIIISIIIFIVLVAVEAVFFLQATAKFKEMASRGIHLTESDLPDGWKIIEGEPLLMGFSSYFLEYNDGNAWAILYIWPTSKSSDQKEFNEKINSEIDGANCVISIVPETYRRTRPGGRSIAVKGIKSDCRKDNLKIDVDFFQPTDKFDEQSAREQIKALAKAVLDKSG